MLTQEENEILCRVGPGTPMGKLLREYWIPLCISSELQVDGPARKVRLLGEDLVSFRVTSGKVGLIQTNCAHRGVAMYFGRNEEEGLTCPYHGWKYDTEGQCVDTPEVYAIRPAGAILQTGADWYKDTESRRHVGGRLFADQ